MLAALTFSLKFNAVNDKRPNVELSVSPQTIKVGMSGSRDSLFFSVVMYISKSNGSSNEKKFRTELDIVDQELIGSMSVAIADRLSRPHSSEHITREGMRSCCNREKLF